MSDREKYDRDFVNTGDDVAGNSYTGKSLIRQLLDRKLLDRRSATGKKSPRELFGSWLCTAAGGNDFFWAESAVRLFWAESTQLCQ